jgi:hypothetical protein
VKGVRDVRLCAVIYVSCLMSFRVVMRLISYLLRKAEFLHRRRVSVVCVEKSGFLHFVLSVSVVSLPWCEHNLPGRFTPPTCR